MRNNNSLDCSSSNEKEKQQDFRERRKRRREGEQLAENIFLYSQSHFLPSSLLFASYCIFTVLCSSSRSARFFPFPFVDLTNTHNLVVSLSPSLVRTNKPSKPTSLSSQHRLMVSSTFFLPIMSKVEFANSQPLVLNLRKPFQHQMRISCIEDMRIKTLFFCRYFLHLLILPVGYQSSCFPSAKVHISMNPLRVSLFLILFSFFPIMKHQILISPTEGNTFLRFIFFC